jgi:ATP-dependent protease ClpP protease subunit
MTPRAWYKFQNRAEDSAVVDVFILDYIGDWFDTYYGVGISAKTFVDELSKLPANVTGIRVHVNSPGGDVFAAVTIANALRDQRTSKARAVDVVIEGIAASAASLIIMAGTTIRISDNALVMVHNPMTALAGNAADLRKTAETLDAIRDTIIATYQWHSQLTAEELGALLDAETWMSADDAIANGFATEKVEGLRVAAFLEPSVLARLTVPEKFRAQVTAFITPPPAAPPATATASEVLAAVDAAGFSAAFARELIEAALPMPAVTAKITAATNARTAADARAAEITALCATAKLPDLASGYIAGAMPVADVRTHLTTITAKLDRIEIHGDLDPDQGVRPKPVINVAAIYAARNQAQ